MELLESIFFGLLFFSVCMLMDMLSLFVVFMLNWLM